MVVEEPNERCDLRERRAASDVRRLAVPPNVPEIRELRQVDVHERRGELIRIGGRWGDGFGVDAARRVRAVLEECQQDTPSEGVPDRVECPPQRSSRAGHGHRRRAAGFDRRAFVGRGARNGE
ncbi:hypothetical protein JCM17092_08900 [Haloplanus litoreus]